MENNKIVVNVDGKDHTYKVLLNVEDVEGKNYCVYTEEEVVDGNIITYASEYTVENDKYKLKNIKDDKTWEFIKDLLNSLQNIEE